MSLSSSLTRFATAVLFLIGLTGLVTTAHAADKAGKSSVVIQVSDNDPSTWNQALNVAENVPEMLGKENVDVEIVAFGKGLSMLKFDSEVGARLKKVNENGVGLRACGVTMKKNNLTDKDLYPGVTVVPAGVVEIIKKHKEGWTVVKP